MLDHRNRRRPRALAAVAAALAFSATTAVAVGAADFGFLLKWGTRGNGNAQFNIPDNAAVDARGNVYVADRGNNRIQKFDSNGNFLARFGRGGGDGSSGRGNGEFRRPYGVAVDELGNVYVGDSGNNRIQKFSPQGTFITRWGRNGGDGSAGRGNGEFNDPRGLATDVRGNVYVADHDNHRVQKFTSDGRFIRRWGRNGGDGTRGSGNGEFNQPRGVAVDSIGGVYVADKSNHRIQKFTTTGIFLTRWGRAGGAGIPGAGNGEFNTPYSVTADAARNVYVADTNNHRVQKFTSNGAFLARFGRNGGDGSAGAGDGEFNHPYGVAADCRSSLFVTDEDNFRVQKFGSRSAPAPRCPPIARLAFSERRGTRAGLAIYVTCDRPCVITATATVLLGGRRIARYTTQTRTLNPLVATKLRLRMSGSQPTGVRTALRNGRRVFAAVRISARGFGGTSTAVERRARLFR